MSLFYLGRIDKAIQSAKERMDLSNPSSYNELSFILLNSGNYEEAIDAQQKALELLVELKSRREQSLAGSPSFFISVTYSALN